MSLITSLPEGFPIVDGFKRFEEMDRDESKRWIRRKQAHLFNSHYDPSVYQTAFFLPGPSPVSDEIVSFRKTVNTTKVFCIPVESDKNLSHHIPKSYWDSSVIVKPLHRALKKSQHPISFVSADFFGIYGPSSTFYRTATSRGPCTEKIIQAFCDNMADKAFLSTNHGVNFRNSAEYDGLVVSFQRAFGNNNFRLAERYYDIPFDYIFKQKIQLGPDGSSIFFGLLKLIEQTNLGCSIRVLGYKYVSQTKRKDERECGFYLLDKTQPFNFEETLDSLFEAYQGKFLSHMFLQQIPFT